jgi:hypothetical protein
MAIITIAASKPNVRFFSTIPENFPKKKPPTQNLKEETQAETQKSHNIKENKVSRSMPKWPLLLYCRKLYEQLEETNIICLSSKPHQGKRNPFTEKRKKNTTQSLELTQE